MLSKWKIELIAFLASLSLISVGFSSWNISYTIPVIETIGGTVQTDYVLKTDDYVYFSKDNDKSTDDGVILPDFNAGGFVNFDESTKLHSNSATSKILLYLKVDGAKCNGTDSVLIKNGDTKINIICEITLASKQTEFFHNNITSFKATTTDGIILEEEYIPNSNGQRVGYRIKILSYNYQALQQNYGLIPVTITLNSSAKEDINNLLENNIFIFHTEVNGVK